MLLISFQDCLTRSQLFSLDTFLGEFTLLSWCLPVSVQALESSLSQACRLRGSWSSRLRIVSSCILSFSLWNVRCWRCLILQSRLIWRQYERRRDHRPEALLTWIILDAKLATIDCRFLAMWLLTSKVVVIDATTVPSVVNLSVRHGWRNSLCCWARHDLFGRHFTKDTDQSFVLEILSSCRFCVWCLEASVCL